MLALVMMVLLPMQEPAPAAAAATPSFEEPKLEELKPEEPKLEEPKPEEPKPEEPKREEAGAPTVPTEAQCLALLQAKKADEARSCYARRTALEGEAGQRARELADLTGSLKLEPPGDLDTPTPGPPTLGEIFTSGKAELAGTAMLAGGSVALLGVSAVLQNSGFSSATGALLLLAPVAGGAAGLGAGTAAVLLWQDMSAGDANAARAVLLLGGFNSAALPFLLLAAFPTNPALGAPVLLGMGGVVVASGFAAGTVAVLTDLPEAAGSMAVSGGLWSSVLLILGADMMQVYKDRPGDSVYLVTAATNAGFVGGMLLSTVVPMTRAETWAIDVGGGVGLAAGASIAVFGRAPNPFIGWGTMALGTALGMGAGFAVARFGAEWLDAAMPDGNKVAVVPLVMPDVDDATGRTLAIGGALAGSF